MHDALKSGAPGRDDEVGFAWPKAARIVAVAVGAIVAWLHLGDLSKNWSLPGLLAIVFGGWPVFREAAEDVAARRMTMELPYRSP